MLLLLVSYLVLRDKMRVEEYFGKSDRWNFAQNMRKNISWPQRQSDQAYDSNSNNNKKN